MTIIGAYDPYLVALSIAVACFASYAALDLGSRIRNSRRWARLVWLATAAIAMGGGIWSMHFIGMLAFIMPIAVSYDISLTLLSLIVAIGVTGFGFFTIGTREVTAHEFTLSSIFMGIGIVSMHYVGMAAMRMPADIRYNTVLVALSVLIAIGASVAALWLAFRTTLTWQRLLGAVVMGSAISAMHYTGMTAATFIADPGMDGARSKPVLMQMDLGPAIATITFVILLLALVASAFDRKLAESEARFRATFENAAVGIAHVTPDGRLLRFNKAISRILGWPADELITKSFQEITHPDDFAAELADFERLRDGKIDSYGVDKRGLRNDGTFFWMRLTRSCVRKSDGSIDYFVSVVEDISARKRAEEQVHLLMREANHRVKNQLGLVQAIARQTVAAEFIGCFTERIQALAANQDLLGRDEQRGADLEDLVRAQLAHFADLVGSRIVVHGPKLYLNATAAQAVGLALHELATNAAKYGALSTDAGRVDVGWQLDGDSFTMSWTERGGPPVRPPERRGFGSTVIEAMAKRAVDGEVQLDYAPSGLGWHLTCPRGNALEPRT